MKQEQERLNEYSSSLLLEHKNKVHIVMLEGNAPQTIVTYATENHFDMIAMNTLGRRGIQQAVDGHRM